MVKEIKVLFSNESKAWKGTADDPVRVLICLYTHNGELILSYDPCGDTKFNEWNLDKAMIKSD